MVEKKIETLKMMLIGDHSVGKTAIIEKFSSNKFTEDNLPTMGVDFIVKTQDFVTKTLNLQIFDTSGQERYDSFIKGSHFVIFVYDITNYNSFKNIDVWFERINSYLSDAVILLFGTKSDLAKNRQVTTDEGMKKANDYKMKFFEVSAKSGNPIEENVQALFKQKIFKENK